MRKLKPDEAMDQATTLIETRSGGGWPPFLTGNLLKDKNLNELLWQLRVHSSSVKLPIQALIDAVPRIMNWKQLQRKERVISILQNVDPTKYQYMGANRVEDVNINSLIALITGEDIGSQMAGRALRGLKP